MTWHTLPLLALDTETTGVDIETARIVTASLILTEAGTTLKSRSWLANPGIAIPVEAERVHGVSTKRAREEGQHAGAVADEVTSHLLSALRRGLPIVAMNASFDLSILDRECRRYRLPTLEQRLGRPISPVIDPLTIDKQADKYRKGRRNLGALCSHYGVTLTDAHTSDADAVAAAQVAIAIAERYPQLQQASLEQLHQWQIGWAAEQSASLQAYFRRQPGRETEVVDGTWPLRPIPITT